MARNTARTGKLKRSKARKESPVDPAQPHSATVGELLAALDGSEPPADPDAAAKPVAEEAAAGAADPASTEAVPDGPIVLVDEDPDDLGLDGYDDGELVEPAPKAKAKTEPTEPLPDGVELSDSLPMAPEDDITRVRGRASPRLVSVVESLLFASERPLTVRDIRKVLKEPTVRQVQLALRKLQADTAKRGVVLSQVAGGFRLRTNPNNSRWVQKMLAGKPARLSRSQLEALAVIAYRQPITKAEIDNVRGVDCGAVLRVLLERDLARIVGRKEEAGRPHLYGTTVEFLEFFNLRSLRDMPDLHEFQELTEESRATLRDSLGEEAEEVEAEVLGQEVLQFKGDEAEVVEAANGADPPAEEPASEGAPPDDDAAASSDGEVASEEDGAASSEGEVASEEDGAASSDDEVASEEDGAASSDDEVASEEDVASSDLVEDVASSDDAVALDEDDASTSDGDEVASEDEDASPRDGDDEPQQTAPLGDVAEPRDEGTPAEGDAPASAAADSAEPEVEASGDDTDDSQVIS